MGHASSVDAQAAFRDQLRRSAVLRHRLAAVALRRPFERFREWLEAWLHERAAAKEARSRPRSSAG